MKKILLSFLALFLFFPSLGWSVNQVLPSLEKTPLPQLHIPKIRRLKLKSGMKLFFLRDEEMPVVRGYIYIRTGSIYDPPGQSGVAGLTGELLRTGGTRSRSPEEFNEQLASLGAEIQSGTGRDYGFVSFQCLQEDFPQVLQMVFEMLREPAFSEGQLALAKRQMIEALRRQNDEPTSIAMREFPKLIYGKDNVWSRTPTRQSVQGVTRKEVLDFYRRFYFPDRIIFALAGDFQASEVKRMISQDTNGWEKAKTPLPKIRPLTKTWEKGIFQIDKGTDQTTLILGHYGEKRFNPDKFALLLLNDILGGEVMGSRLGEKVRSSLGLAYGIYSQFGFETDYGIFYIFAQTKAPSTQRVLSEIQKILKDTVRGENLTQQELEEHKRSVLNSLYSQYEPRFNFVKDEARFDYYKYPPNYLKIFRKNIQKVTLADIRRVAKKYLRPDALKVLVVGDMNKIGKLPGSHKIDMEAF